MNYVASYILVVDSLKIRKLKGLNYNIKAHNIEFPESKIDFKVAHLNSFQDMETPLPDPASDNIIVKLLRKTPEDNYFGKSFYNELKKGIRTIVSRIKKEYGNVTYVNGPEGILELRNKKIHGEILIKNGIPHPTLYNDISLDELIEIIKDRPICIKPCSGSIGRGITRIKNANNSYLISTTYTKKSVMKSNYLKVTNNVTNLIINKKRLVKFLDELLKTGVVVQNWIEPLRLVHEKQLKIFDIRELLVYPKYNKGVTAQLVRISNNELITNISANENIEGDYTDLYNLLGEEGIVKSEELSIEACKCFPDINVTGVDVLWSKTSQETDNPYAIKLKGKEVYPYVLELNAMPGVKSASVSGVNNYAIEILGALKDSGYELNDKQEKKLRLIFNDVRTIINELI